MHALVIGSASRLEALKAGIGQRWTLDYWEWPSRVSPGWGYYELIIDLEADERPSPAFSTPNKAFWLLQAVKKPLRTILPSPSWWDQAVGVNLLPGFCQRPLLEVSALSSIALERLKAWEPHFALVPDEVGMASARILALLINEALLLAEESQTPLSTIDTAVKLGLNYPQTITEWGKWMGWPHVRDILLALAHHYGEGHYPIAQALKEARYPSLEG